MSVGVPWRMSASVLSLGMYIGVSSGVFGDVLGPQGCSEVYLRAEFMRDPVWLEPTHHFSKTRKARFVFT